jgi:hypothetical protein
MKFSMILMPLAVASTSPMTDVDSESLNPSRQGVKKTSMEQNCRACR